MLTLQITITFPFANKRSYVNVKRKLFLKTGHFANNIYANRGQLLEILKRGPKMWKRIFVSKLVILITLHFKLALLFICLEFSIKKNSPLFQDLKSFSASIREKILKLCKFEKSTSIGEVVTWDSETIFYLRYILNFLVKTNHQIATKYYYLLRFLGRTL